MPIVWKPTVSPKTITNLQRSYTKNSSIIKPLVVNEIIKPLDVTRDLPGLFLPYQVDWLNASEQHKVLVCCKSRRIGLSFIDAAIAVLQASRRVRPANQLYIGTSLNMCREYLANAAFFARIFNIAVSEIQEEIVKDEREDILTLRIHFTSGKKIIALSSRPDSIRGYTGTVIIDEGSFLEQGLNAFLESCLPQLIWGYQLRIISTLNGVDNDFTRLCENIIKGELKYHLQTTTFREAVSQGLYERVCLISGQPYSIELERKWLAEIYDLHGHNSSQELDCIPKANSDDSIFNPDWFQMLEQDEIPISFDNICRFHDFAATNKDTSYYSASVLMGIKNGKKYILDWQAHREDAGSSEDRFMAITKKDTKKVIQYFELEQGASAMRYEVHLKKSLPGYIIKGIRPEGSKLIRAMPVVRECKNGNYYILNAKWTPEFLKVVSRFNSTDRVPLVSDTIDALSGADNALTRKVNHLLTS
jgi:predicted phage terminase large subunit-like protein